VDSDTPEGDDLLHEFLLYTIQGFSVLQNSCLSLLGFSKIAIVIDQSGKLKRKSSGGERAWILEEESEPRNKEIFLAGENHRADVSACQTDSTLQFWSAFLILV
jgi:hypothetical protein